MGRARESTANATITKGWSELRHQAGLDKIRALVLTKQR